MELFGKSGHILTIADKRGEIEADLDLSHLIGGDHSLDQLDA